MLSGLKGMIGSSSTGVRATLVYTFATLFTRGLAIITVPIFTRIMTASEIGEVNLYSSWYSLLSVVATLSLTSGGFSVAMLEFEDERDRYMSSVLSITSLMTLLIAAVFIWNPSFWSELIGLPESLLFLMILGFLVTPARDFWFARQRYEYKYKSVAFLTIVSATLATTLSITVVLMMNGHGRENIVEARLFANSSVLYGFSAFLWVYLVAKGKTFYHKKYWKLSLSLSVPLVGHSLASQVLSVSDRMMIDKMIGKSEVGIYSTLYTVSSISLMVWGAINSSFIPFLYQNINQDDKREKIAKTTNGLIILYAGIAILFTFFAPEIIKVLATEEYYKAIYIMPPIATGVFLTAISNVYTNVLLYSKKSNMIMISSITAAIFNVILNLIFIPIFGYMAAAYTTLFAYVMMAFLQAVCSNIIYKNSTGKKQYIYNNGQILIIAIATMLISMTGLIWYQYTLLRYGVILCGFIVVSLYYIRIMKR